MSIPQQSIESELYQENQRLRAKLGRVADLINVFDSMEEAPIDADLVAEDLRDAICDEFEED